MTQDGPGKQFEDFVRDYGERAYQFAYRLSGNVEEAKDLVSEAFFRALRSWEQYDKKRSLDAWFFTILRHLFLDGRKRYARRHLMSMDETVESEEGASSFADLLPDEEEAVLERLERDESAELVRCTLDKLSYEHRVVLTLCDMERLSYEQIAEVLDAPVGTIRSRLARARTAFRRVIARSIEVR